MKLEINQIRDSSSPTGHDLNQLENYREMIASFA